MPLDVITRELSNLLFLAVAISQPYLKRAGGALPDAAEVFLTIAAMGSQ